MIDKYIPISEKCYHLCRELLKRDIFPTPTVINEEFGRVSNKQSSFGIRMNHDKHNLLVTDDNLETLISILKLNNISKIIIEKVNYAMDSTN